MAVLVIADHDGSTVRETTAKTVTAAAAIGGDIDILVVGQGAKAAADSAAKISGVRKVLLAESAGLGKTLAEAVEATVLPLAPGYDAILQAVSKRPLTELDPPVLDVLRLGAHQLLAMRVPQHAAVDATVALA